MYKNKFNLRNVVVIAICLAGTTMLLGCKASTDSFTYDEGVVINGVKWATRNVDKPGTFAVNPEDAGMFYQWNCNVALPVTGSVTNWDSSNNLIEDKWEKSNDPSPIGWRVPTIEETEKLLDREKVTKEWATINGVNGMKFIDKITGNSLFLPAVGRRDSSGTLVYAENGYYWSNSRVMFENFGLLYYGILTFLSDNAAAFKNFGNRSSGLSVRCVEE